MPKFEWNASLATSHPKIDEQHQALIQACNRLREAVEQGWGSQETHKTLIFLSTYTMQHFQMEEGLMDEAHYPDAPRHKQLHHDLVVKLSGLLKQDLSGAGGRATIILDFLEGWLVEHIQGEDFRLAEFLRSR